MRVWTNVGDAHVGFFASADAIADAKAEILEAARPGDLLVANADDERIRARIGAFPGRTVTFGLSDGAAVRASRVEHRGLDGMGATVRTPHGETRSRDAAPGQRQSPEPARGDCRGGRHGRAAPEIAARAARG